MKLDRNGYGESIMLTEPGRCFCCNRLGDTCRHEAYGSANRRISKAHGMWINCCPACHDIIHLKPDDGRMDRWVKKVVYQRFCELHGREEFRKLIGRYYED